jgi:hypothetical protein
VWALVIRFGPYCGLFDFEETIRWVSMSAPAECSTRGLGGRSDPFKGLLSSEWAHLGKTRGHTRAVTVVTLSVVVCGNVGGLCSVGYLSGPGASLLSGGCKPPVRTVHLLEAWHETNVVPLGDE